MGTTSPSVLHRPGILRGLWPKYFKLGAISELLLACTMGSGQILEDSISRYQEKLLLHNSIEPDELLVDCYLTPISSRNFPIIFRSNNAMGKEEQKDLCSSKPQQFVVVQQDKST